jgi:putative redox protein
MTTLRDLGSTGCQPVLFGSRAEKNVVGKLPTTQASCLCSPDPDGDRARDCVSPSPSAWLDMVKVDIKYTGDLHCDATHGPSQSKLATDAPIDNKGKGEAFSPTDLVATALGTCISTTMGIKAEALGVDLSGMTVSVQKEMSKDAPRRIVGLPSEVHVPLPANSPHRKILEQTALNCPVHKSLPPEINRPTKFFWEG